MDRTFNFLKEAGTFYLATVDGPLPRVRPFGAICRYNGKLYICTNNKKACYKQMLANPNVEISAMAGQRWIRLAGTVARDPSQEARQAMLDANERLKRMYAADDGVFEVLYFTQGTASFYSFGGEPEVEELARSL
jgi:uncharacterized pyridoxamine 5'-phosphate oxidase family protein